MVERDCVDTFKRQVCLLRHLWTITEIEKVHFAREVFGGAFRVEDGHRVRVLDVARLILPGPIVLSARGVCFDCQIIKRGCLIAELAFHNSNR